MSGVIEYLRGRGAPFMVLPCAEASSPAETAVHHGVDLDALIDTVVMESREGRALMVVPATRKLSLGLAREALGDPDARLTSPLELRYHPSGYVPGAWPRSDSTWSSRSTPIPPWRTWTRSSSRSGNPRHWCRSLHASCSGVIPW